MDDNRPASSVVDVGRDAWSLGATVSIPLDQRKYHAMREEALWKHAATQSGVADVRREFDAQLLTLLDLAKMSYETARLYETTIIPQAQQTLSVDQEALALGTADFGRVIQDVRSLLTLQFAYHRSVGQVATSVARIQQAVGIDLQPLAGLSNQ